MWFFFLLISSIFALEYSLYQQLEKKNQLDKNILLEFQLLWLPTLLYKRELDIFHNSCNNDLKLSTTKVYYEE